MRKNKFLLLSVLVFISNLTFGQSTIGGGSPVPSVSNLPALVDSSPGIATGIPNINFPLFSVRTHCNGLSVNLSLQYSISVIKSDQTASEVGLGWNLSGATGIIYEQQESIPSKYRYTNYNPPLNNVPAEKTQIFYFSTPTFSGKFSIVRKQNGEFIVINRTAGDFQVTYTGTAHENYFDVNSFTIIDGKGLKYIFQTKSISEYPVDYLIKYTNDNEYHITQTTYESYTSAYYLDRITDTNNQTLINYIYYYYPTPSNANNTTYIRKVQKIEIIDFGTLIYNYNYQANTTSDPYSVTNIVLKDNNQNIISQYDFEYTSLHHAFFDDINYVDVYKRGLVAMKKRDKYSNILDKINFTYDTEGSYHIYGSPEEPISWGLWPLTTTDHNFNPKFETIGMLKEVILPSKGKIKYTFVPNEIATYIDRTTPEFEQSVLNGTAANIEDLKYLVKKDSVYFDTNNNQRIFPLTMNSTGDIFIKFNKEELYPTYDPEEDLPPLDPVDPFLNFKIKKGSIIVNGNLYEEAPDWFINRYYNLYGPQNYNIEIEGLGKGWFSIYEVKVKNPPYYNVEIEKGAGVRIDKIEYYLKSTDINPAKTVNYNYLRKDKVRTSSSQPTSGFYSQVSISNSEAKGEETNYYKEEYPPQSYDTDGTPIHIYLPEGTQPILKKIESYDVNNNKLKEVRSNKVFSPVGTRFYLNDNNTNYSKLGFLSTQSDTVRIYNYQNQYIETIEKSVFNKDNFGLSKKTTIDQDGTITETEYKYATEKGNTKLLGAHILSVPLEVTQKQNNLETGKIETFYAHTDNYYPSSVKSSGINGAVINEEKNDIYDTMGNVLQSTSKTGIPTTYIYGYNSTILIAKIEGLKYSEVMAAFGLSSSADAYKNLEIYTKSNQDVSDATEEILRQKLDDFRLKPAFKNYQVTTYTYDPLIGVKSVTSPSGNKEYYFYDNANRLIRVEDINHNIIKDYQYKSSL